MNKNYEEDPDLARWEAEYGWMDDEEPEEPVPLEVIRKRDRSYRKIDKKMQRSRAKPKTIPPRTLSNSGEVETEPGHNDLDELAREVSIDALQQIAEAQVLKQS